MKRGRSTLILLVLAAALGGYIWFVERESSTSDDEPKAERVFAGLDQDAIEALTLKAGNGDETSLRKKGTAWTIEAPIAVPADVPLVITEGNYLLADQEPWKEIRAQLDEVWFLETPHGLRISRLVARHASFGMAPDAAEAWANGPDEANAVLIRSTRHAADRIIPWL